MATTKAPKKSICKVNCTHVRNPEVKLRCGGVYCHTRCQCAVKPQEDFFSQGNPRSNSKESKFSKPTLNSILRTVNEVEKLQAMPLQIKLKKDMTPRSKAIIAPKISQKLNFHADKPVFKNLPPINVNDSILQPQRSLVSLKNKYKVTANKMPTLELSDFLEPIPPLTHVIPEPSIVQTFSVPPFDYLENYRRLVE